MSCKSRGVPLWDHQCILPSRRKTLRYRKLKRDDLNPWLSEYQRSYCRSSNYRGPGDMPAWVPAYTAQLKRKAEIARGGSGGGGGWAVGAGDCHGCKTKVSHSESAAAREINNAQIKDRHQYQYQTSNGDDRYGTLPQNRQTPSSQSQQQQQQQLQTTGAVTAGESSGQTSGPSSSSAAAAVDVFLPTQVYGERKSGKSDSGLRDMSMALRLWKKNAKSCNKEFSCLPWHQQLTKAILEERENNPDSFVRRIY